MTNRRQVISFTRNAFLFTGLAMPLIAQQVAPPPRENGGQAIGYRSQSVINGVQITEPDFEDKYAVLDALPDHAPAKPLKPRKVFVFARALGYFHSNIPIAAFTIKALGDKTGAWSTTTSFKLSDFTAENLAQYDAIVLDNTSGEFLDDPADEAGNAARHKALLDFIRGGKGLVLLHAATTGYAPKDSRHLPNGTTAPAQPGWPEWNKIAGGSFKWHWIYPTEITVKIDDPGNPINAAFRGKEFTVHDETYTFHQDSFSRKNVHVLLSIDYAKMSDDEKKKEPAATRRTDGDYALSWIRPEGKGRLFYQALGHSEHVFAITPFLEQLLAGTQYALGDLKVDDSPSQK